MTRFNVYFQWNKIWLLVLSALNKRSALNPRFLNPGSIESSQSRLNILSYIGQFTKNYLNDFYPVSVFFVENCRQTKVIPSHSLSTSEWPSAAFSQAELIDK